MFIFTIVFNIVQGNVVAPIVYGRAVSLHPAIVLIAIPAGAALAGIAGMFLIVPVHRRRRGDVELAPALAGRLRRGRPRGRPRPRDRGPVQHGR